MGHLSPPKLLTCCNKIMRVVDLREWAYVKAWVCPRRRVSMMIRATVRGCGIGSDRFSG